MAAGGQIAHDQIGDDGADIEPNRPKGREFGIDHAGLKLGHHDRTGVQVAVDHRFRRRHEFQLQSGDRDMQILVVGQALADQRLQRIVLEDAPPGQVGEGFRLDPNAAQDADLPGWLTLGQVSIGSIPARPNTSGTLSPSGFTLLVSNAAPGVWAVQHSSNFACWTLLLSTNTTTWQWGVTDVLSSLGRFYRVVGSP